MEIQFKLVGVRNLEAVMWKVALPPMAAYKMELKLLRNRTSAGGLFLIPTYVVKYTMLVHCSNPALF